jgi:hypothetical protein
MVESGKMIGRRIGRIVHRRVVSRDNQFRSPQGKHAIALGPPPVVATHHTHNTPDGTPRGKPEITDAKVEFLEILKWLS